LARLSPIIAAIASNGGIKPSSSNLRTESVRSVAVPASPKCAGTVAPTTAPSGQLLTYVRAAPSCTEKAHRPSAEMLSIVTGRENCRGIVIRSAGTETIENTIAMTRRARGE